TFRLPFQGRCPARGGGVIAAPLRIPPLRVRCAHPPPLSRGGNAALWRVLPGSAFRLPFQGRCPARGGGVAAPPHSSPPGSLRSPTSPLEGRQCCPLAGSAGEHLSPPLSGEVPRKGRWGGCSAAANSSPPGS